MFPIWILLLFAPAGPRELTRMVADSGRVLQIAVPPAERAAPPKEIAPGAPPLVSFRYFDGRERHRFGNLDLVADDAGH